MGAELCIVNQPPIFMANAPTLLITTPTGNSGQHVLRTVLASGAAVRVLVRDPARLPADLPAGNLEIIQGDLHRPADLAHALDGIEGAFFCVPQSPDPADIGAYYRSFTEPFAEAARAAGLRRVVSISGGDGAGSGFRGVGQALWQVEQTLEAAVPAARHLRCGYFMENFYWLVEGLARAGVFALPVAADVPVPFVAAADIGRAGGHLLLDTAWTGHDGLAAHGPHPLTCAQAAEELSAALGFAVRFQPISGAQYKASVAPHGVSEALGQSLVEMFEAIAAGRDMGAPAAHYAACPTTLREWASGGLRHAAQRIRAGQSPASR